jgi:hypothetical protein
MPAWPVQSVIPQHQAIRENPKTAEGRGVYIRRAEQRDPVSSTVQTRWIVRVCVNGAGISDCDLKGFRFPSEIKKPHKVAVIESG